MHIKKQTFLALVLSVALILSYIEVLLPPISAMVPGIKMGLANIVIVFVLYRFSYKEAIIVSGLRLFISALLFSNPVTFVYSLAGAVLSLLVMSVLKKVNLFSVTAVSVVGAIFHNLGQILVAMLFLKTAEIGYYMIVLSVSGTVSGIVVGIAAALLSRALKNVKI